jgi:1-acyl-sn-glycerol-3-phosphate acyltransferase
MGEGVSAMVNEGEEQGMGPERKALDRRRREPTSRTEDGQLAENPFQRDEAFLERLLPWMDLFSRYFDGEVSGFETLPEEGPMLLIGNHSGGTIVPDTAVTIAAWYRERGIGDPLLGLAFDGAFDVPGFETLMRKLGEIPASHENAERALETGNSLLVYPGGAREAFRPWTDRNRIEFSGHKGFVKLALRTGVPVVPVVAHGGHHTTFVLSRGEEIAERLGTDALPISIAPVVFQVPWGVSIPILPGIPLPAKIVVELGPPLDWSHYGPEAAEDPETVDRCYEEITGRMQGTLDRLARDLPYPVAQRVLGLLSSAIRRRARLGR